MSPNGETKNEINYILTDRHGIFSDMSVFNSINTGRDHRIVQGRAQINTKLERAKLTMQPKKIDTNKLRKHQVKFEAELQNRFSMLDDIPHDDLDATADTITKIIHITPLLVAGQHQGEKPDKLSTRTKMLRDKRRVMRGGTHGDNLEYIQTCKAIRQGMKDDIQAFNEKQVLEAWSWLVFSGTEHQLKLLTSFHLLLQTSSGLKGNWKTCPYMVSKLLTEHAQRHAGKCERWEKWEP